MFGVWGSDCWLLFQNIDISTQIVGLRIQFGVETLAYGRESMIRSKVGTGMKCRDVSSSSSRCWNLFLAPKFRFRV